MNKISEEQKTMIWNMRKLGYSQYKISKELKISLATISKYCKLLDPKGELKTIKNISEQNKELIISKYIEFNNNLVKTVHYFKFWTRTQIRNILIKNNIYVFKKKMDKLEKNKRQVKNVVKYRTRKKLELIEYKGGKCQICGYNKCPRALEFHHLDPSKKDFSISQYNWKIEFLKKEVDKCILVCSNCHREIHYSLDNKNGGIYPLPDT